MNDVHSSFFLAGSTDKGLVIFIHGFMGSPRQFDFLSESVHSQGYSAASLLLPGHGVSCREFSSGTAQAWLNHVYAETERYACCYNNIYFVGHSMGGLLALNAAGKFAEQVRGVFLVACPFKLRRLSAYTLLARLKQAFYRKMHPLKAAYLRGCSVPLSPSLIWHSAKPAAELKKLVRMTTDILPGLQTPVTAVYSTADEAVSIKSLPILQSGLTHAAFEHTILNNSLHAYYPPHEQKVIESALLRNIHAAFPE